MGKRLSRGRRRIAPLRLGFGGRGRNLNEPEPVGERLDEAFELIGRRRPHAMDDEHVQRLRRRRVIVDERAHALKRVGVEHDRRRQRGAARQGEKRQGGERTTPSIPEWAAEVGTCPHGSSARANGQSERAAFVSLPRPFLQSHNEHRAAHAAADVENALDNPASRSSAVRFGFVRERDRASHDSSRRARGFSRL